MISRSIQENKIFEFGPSLIFIPRNSLARRSVPFLLSPRLFVFHPSNTILVTVHSTLLYLISIGDQRSSAICSFSLSPARVHGSVSFPTTAPSDVLISPHPHHSLPRSDVSPPTEPPCLPPLLVYVPRFVHVRANDSITTPYERRESDLHSARLLARCATLLTRGCITSFP